MMEYCDVCGKEVETQVITRQETYVVVFLKSRKYENLPYGKRSCD